MVENLAETLRLMLVTDDGLLAGRDLVEVCQAAVRGGATAVQLRLKKATPAELVTVLRRLQAEVEVPVLVNDRLDVALAGGADGVHLGPDDVPVTLARRIAPAGFLIGASVGSSVESENAREADYWGIGPYRETGTKADAGEALGSGGVQRIIALAGGKPCVVIGGVRPSDVGDVRKAGAAGVAVVSGILGGADIAAAARSYGLALHHR